jgi:hypothetical protein
LKYSIKDLITGHMTDFSYLLWDKGSQLQILPANPNLIDIEPELLGSVDGRLRLKARLAPIVDQYDYVVTTNVFPSRGDCPVDRIIVCSGSLSFPIWRADDAALTIPPALVDRTWSLLASGRLRPRNTAHSPMGRHVPVGGPGRRRGPLVRPAFPQIHDAWTSTHLDTSVMSVGTPETRVEFFGRAHR